MGRAVNAKGGGRLGGKEKGAVHDEEGLSMRKDGVI